LSKFRKTEIYSRVVGYLRPVEQWNKGKQAEWGKRVKYDEKKAIKAAEGK
jgi:ribonucleoside-triphosphate reductase